MAVTVQPDEGREGGALIGLEPPVLLVQLAPALGSAAGVAPAVLGEGVPLPGGEVPVDALHRLLLGVVPARDQVLHTQFIKDADPPLGEHELQPAFKAHGPFMNREHLPVPVVGAVVTAMMIPPVVWGRGAGTARRSSPPTAVRQCGPAPGRAYCLKP